MMELLRRVVGHLGSREEAVANQLEQRQDASTSAAASTPASSASPASRSSAATATDASITSSTSSGSASSATASASPSASDAGDHTVTDFVSTPAFTVTRTTAYIANGINATIVDGTSTSTYTASAYLATANATAPGIPSNELTACQINGTTNNGPFCSPKQEQNLWVGYTYALTWNPALLSNNATDIIVLRYNDQQQGVVWNSSAQPNGKGYVNINMDKSWLMGASGNDSTLGQNLTFYLQSGAQDPTQGPMISLVINPETLPPVPFHKLPAKLGLEIGLPVGVAAAILIILALWCGMRRNNRSWRDIKGHGADYMVRRSRKRGRVGKESGIQLEEYNHPRQQGAFSDEPCTGASGNAFRDEVARQREEDDRSRTYVTSF